MMAAATSGVSTVAIVMDLSLSSTLRKSRKSNG